MSSSFVELTSPTPTLQNLCQDAKSSFYEFYQKRASVQKLEDIEHIITCLNECLELWKTHEDGSFERIASMKTPASEEEYCFYKTFSHLSVILYNILESILHLGARSDDDENILQEEKKRLHLFLLAEHPVIDSNRETIKEFLFFIEEILLCNSKEEALFLLSHYSKKIAFVNERYPMLAAEVQLSGMHRIVSNWLEEKALNLYKTTVLFAVAASPRQGLIEGQYFNRLYLEYGVVKPEENRRLFFFEMLPQQIGETTSTCLIEELKKRYFNTSIGETMLGDPDAMDKDVLAPYAPPPLNKLFPSASKKRCPYSKATELLENLTFPARAKLEILPASPRWPGFFMKSSSKYAEIKKSVLDDERPFPRFY